MARTITLPILFAALVGQGLQAQSYTISYEWLNVPCFSNIHCSNGCSACNVPDNSSSLFFGTNMIWPGLQLCPHPVSPQNNALHVSGWPVFAEPNVYGKLSGLSTIPLQVDSIILRHRTDWNGPERLRISFTTDVSQPEVEVADIAVGLEWTETVVTNLGRMDIAPGNAFGTFALMVQAYQGQGGSWQLDAIRVVASQPTYTNDPGLPGYDPDHGIATGVTEFQQRNERMKGQFVDVLGRPVGRDAAPGMYIGDRRVVRVY